jgi:hypothetical protein
LHLARDVRHHAAHTGERGDGAEPRRARVSAHRRRTAGGAPPATAEEDPGPAPAASRGLRRAAGHCRTRARRTSSHGLGPPRALQTEGPAPAAVAQPPPRSS